MTDNGVEWHEWSEEAFRKAKELNRPILMDISAAWCHWCHVMDQTSYSDKEVIRIVNSNFVAIKVDTDQRPDINRRYNVGGWPTTTFLTPEGEMITGATYVPPDQMRVLLRQVSDQYSRSARKRKSTNATRQLQPEPRTKAPSRFESESSDLVVGDVVNMMLRAYDNVYGGFGDQPKFPNPDALCLALEQYYSTRDQGLNILIVKTLNNMASGGMYDRQRGGFFRYATRRDWNIPHYEKILEDNAKLAMIYLDAFRVLGTPEYRQVAEQIINYVECTLSNRQIGGFYGSQDADEEYYRTDLSEHESRNPPKVDTSIYTGPNALMTSTYFLASAVLRRPELEEFAFKTLAFFLDRYRDKTAMLCHTYRSDGPTPLHLMSDQILLARSLVEAYKYSSNDSHMEKAEDLAKLAIDHFYDPDSGGFYDTILGPSSIGLLKVREKIIDENSWAAELLLELCDLTGKKVYVEKAKETLGLFERAYRGYGILASSYARVVYRLNAVLTKIVIIGDKSNQATAILRDEALRYYSPRKTVQVLDPSFDRDKIDSFGYPVADLPKAYVCVGQTCLEPMTNPEELSSRLSKFIAGG